MIVAPPPPPPAPTPASVIFERWVGLSGDGEAYGYVRNVGGTTALYVDVVVRGEWCSDGNPCNRIYPYEAHSYDSGTDRLDLAPGEYGLFDVFSQYCAPSQYCPSIGAQDDYPAVTDITWK